jgi:hypothetical protein
MIDGGALTVTVARDEGGFRVVVDAPPALMLSRMLAGKQAAQAARLTALVFNTGAAAQEGAARAAFGLSPSRGAARRIAIETLRDHAARLCVAWPKALGHTPDMAALSTTRALARDNGAALGVAIFGRDGAPGRLADFETWMRSADTAPSRVLDHVWRRWDARWGRADLPLWRVRPGMPIAEIDWTEGEIGGRPAETGLAARVSDADLMREIAARRGHGISWRLAARLVDCARLLRFLASGEDGKTPLALLPGVGAAEAACGTILVHGAAEGGLVSRFERLSPIDFALHPGGLLDRVMASLPRSRKAPLHEVAALALESVDPCMPTRLVLPARCDA